MLSTHAASRSAQFCYTWLHTAVYKLYAGQHVLPTSPRQHSCEFQFSTSRTVLLAVRWLHGLRKPIGANQYRRTRAGVNMKRPIKTVCNTNRRLPVPAATGVNPSNLVVVPVVSSAPKTESTCILLNAQSVCNKATTVHEHVLDQKADLVFLTETWLKPNNSAVIHEMTPPGYTFTGKCRTTKRGGGVGLLHKSAFHFNKVKTPQYKTF